MSTTTLANALQVVTSERARQDAKWGAIEQRGHGLLRWLAILAEEVGELAAEIAPISGDASWSQFLEYLWRAGEHARVALEKPEPRGVTHDGFCDELIQVAAVAVALIEAVDLGAPTGGTGTAAACEGRPFGLDEHGNPQLGPFVVGDPPWAGSICWHCKLDLLAGDHCVRVETEPSGIWVTVHAETCLSAFRAAGRVRRESAGPPPAPPVGSPA